MYLNEIKYIFSFRLKIATNLKRSQYFFSLKIASIATRNRSKKARNQNVG